MGKKSKSLDESAADESMNVSTNNAENNEESKSKSYEELMEHCQLFANPCASKKLTKKIYKVIKKASKAKQLRRGVRDVSKRIRKGEKGIVVLAGDTFPVDVISHLPVVCEEADIPYCYVPSKEYLGLASGSKRQACAMMVRSHADYEELFAEVNTCVKELPMPL